MRKKRAEKLQNNGTGRKYEYKWSPNVEETTSKQRNIVKDNNPKNSEARNAPNSSKAKNKTLKTDEKSNATCLYCNELYESSKSRERWILCQGPCRRWSHTLCAGLRNSAKRFMCEFCESGLVRQ